MNTTDYYFSSLALDEPDSDSEQPGKDFLEQIPLGEVTTQIAESVKDLLIPAIQDSFPIDRIVDRIEDLARLAEGSSHSQAITNQKLGKLSESLNAVKVELQAASAARIRVEEKLDRLLATEERRFNHTDQDADNPPPAPRISPCYFCDSPNHKLAGGPDRTRCKGCGGDMHPYDKCDHVSKTCARCGLVGHSIRVHSTNNVELREQLIKEHPQEFKHFLVPEAVPAPRNRPSRGPRVGLYRGFRDQESPSSRGYEAHQGGRGRDHGEVDQGNRTRGRGSFGKGRGFIRGK